MTTANSRKYKTQLHTLIATGPTISTVQWVDSILTYLTQNCSVTKSNFLSKEPKPLCFRSPLPINVVPKSGLARELKTVEHGESALNLAISMSCPSEVVAALCHLNPKAASIANSSGALPLHIIVMRPTAVTSKKNKSTIETNTLKSIGILVDVYPDALVTVDTRGKTPLHILLSNHTESRTVRTVEILSRDVNEQIWKARVKSETRIESKTNKERTVPIPTPSIIRKSSRSHTNTTNVFTPASALVIPDAIFGCIPLHYAVMNGASKDIVKYIVKTYPASVARGDGMNKTALHWDLGAAGDSIVSEGTSPKKKQPLHQTYRSSGIISVLLHKDPAFPFEAAKLRDNNTEGEGHRTPLHYAVELIAKNLIDPPSLTIDGDTPTPCLSLKALKYLIDCYRPALTKQDSRGQTPLHVLFRVAHDWNDLQYQKALGIALTGSLTTMDRPLDLKIFSPPTELVNMLMACTMANKNKKESRGKNVGAKAEIEILDSRDDKSRDDQSIEDPNMIFDSAVNVQDSRGLLPLHCAVLAVSAPGILSILLDIHPTSLIQTTYDITNERDAAKISRQYDIIPPNLDKYVSSFSRGGRTPLHLAFANPYVARWHSEFTLEPLLFFNVNSTRPGSSNNATPQIMIDGTIVLKTEDADGETPLHLAARHNASLSMFRILLKCYPEAAATKSKLGNLPLHLLVDEEYFFASIQLSMAGTLDERKENINGRNNPFGVTDDQKSRNKIREMAKIQSTAMRMEEFKICSAIFAPSSGWTSDEDDVERSRGRNDIIQRVFLLSKPLIRHIPSLSSPCSRYSLLPLHIVIAFHALPYKDLYAMLQDAPHTARHRTAKLGFTALDLHNLRSKVAGEISSSESESWRAILQLLFSYEAFPLNDDPTLRSDTFVQIQNDEEKLDSCLQQIMREVDDVKGIRSFHEVGNHPVDPEHIKLGFIKDDDLPSKGKNLVSKGILSDVATRLWMFFTIYQNPADSSQHYARYVSEILSKFCFEKMKTLVEMRVTEDRVAQKISSRAEETVHGYANPHCKAEIHTHYYFAGAYDFESTPGKSILLHRDDGGKTLIVRATEHIFSFRQTMLQTGEVDQAFHCTIEQRPVCIKFTKNRANYENEIRLRTQLGVGRNFVHDDNIAPILSHFDATTLDNKLNKRFALDRMDERFRKLPTYSHMIETSNHNTEHEFIDISSYPYALVSPLSAHANLFESITHGIMDQDMPRCLSKDMGEVLKTLHSKGFIHSSFGITSILAFTSNNPNSALESLRWQLTKLNSLIPKPSVSGPSYQGMINVDGSYVFDSVTFPPEMFTKLDQHDLLIYEQYWQAVFSLEDNNVSPDLVKPRINPLDGHAYVMKCYCNLPDEMQEQMPHLPYDLVEASESADIWAFGVFIFALVSGGETLFQANFKTGNLTCIEIIAAWDTGMAERLLTQYIHDVVAQDLLRHILVPLGERKNLDMSTLLTHPFFNKLEDVPEEFIEYANEMKREREVGQYLHNKKIDDEKQEKLMKSSIKILPRLGIQSALKLATSTSELMKAAFDPVGSVVQLVPMCYILLPYELKLDDDGKFTPTRAHDIELAECFGTRLLALCKMCNFVTCISHSLQVSAKEKGELLHAWTQDIDHDPITSAQSILSSLQLDQVYTEIALSFVSLAHQDMEKFFSDPTTIAHGLLIECTEAVAATYAVRDEAFLYLVDEYNGLPVLDSDVNGIYPHVFRDGVSDIVYKSLPFMHACVSHVIGVAGGVQAFVKLVFEVAYPLVPPQWAIVAQGLRCSVDKAQIIHEIMMLHGVTQKMTNDEDENNVITDSCIDELKFMHDFFQHIDTKRSFCSLRPVTDGKSILWTSEDGSRMLEEECNQEADPEYLQSLICASED